MKKQKDFSKRILVGITGHKDSHWKNKLKEINKLEISKIALFLERFSSPQRKRIYKALLTSKIKKIPLVHIRNDMRKEELVFLVKNFYSSYLTIHEDSFKVLKKWKGFYKHLFLEMNTDNFVSDSVNVGKVGGFCVDLAHFKKEEERWSKEFEYIIKRRKISKFFACNHLNGYTFEKDTDLHTIKNLKDFNYLKTLPKFLFGDIIGLETENGIFKQLEFKKHLVKLLNQLFNK
ncbi:MAG: hypothetical protein GTN36_04355 [Candidatus Aenigmarchaeota archaeon]|nr:hypothetical protein [Candidatus Aenigmarchaeota archaeon]